MDEDCDWNMIDPPPPVNVQIIFPDKNGMQRWCVGVGRWAPQIGAIVQWRQRTMGSMRESKALNMLMSKRRRAALQHGSYRIALTVWGNTI